MVSPPPRKKKSDKKRQPRRCSHVETVGLAFLKPSLPSRMSSIVVAMKANWQLRPTFPFPAKNSITLKGCGTCAKPSLQPCQDHKEDKHLLMLSVPCPTRQLLICTHCMKNTAQLFHCLGCPKLNQTEHK